MKDDETVKQDSVDSADSAKFKNKVSQLEGELITITSKAVVIHQAKDQSLSLKYIPFEQIETIEIDDFIEKYNATFYGSFNWIFLPFLTLTHGIIILYSLPTWIWQIVDASIFGITLNRYQFDVDESFDFTKLKAYARYPNQIPKELQARLSIEEAKNTQIPKPKVELPKKSSFLSFGLGGGLLYSGIGFNVIYHRHIHDKVLVEMGISFPIIPSAFTQLSYQINRKNKISALVGYSYLISDREGWFYFGPSYTYDVGKIKNFHLFFALQFIPMEGFLFPTFGTQYEF